MAVESTDPDKAISAGAESCARCTHHTGPIQQHVKKRLETHAYPRKIAFLKEMLTTKTGKSLKHKLRALHQRSKNPDI